MEKVYQIGDKTYIQKPLVLGQLRQLLDLLQDVVIPGDLDNVGLIMVLGDNLPEALAIVLTEQGRSPRDKNIADMAAEIEFAISPDMALEVIEDFLACNPTASLLERLAGMMERIIKPTGLKTPASVSAPETSQSETVSSGGTP